MKKTPAIIDASDEELQALGKVLVATMWSETHLVTDMETVTRLAKLIDQNTCPTTSTATRMTMRRGAVGMCQSNGRLSQIFPELGKEVGVATAKSLVGVYQNSLERKNAQSSVVDSMRGNLAGAFVNAFHQPRLQEQYTGGRGGAGQQLAMDK
ncbi:hypothetical protein HWV62_22481 [Athelia sp. TMB]|nr:hypothetical protein HWV62_22481 [Athelia sp. TMB]